jgi:DHA2 family multidrug resistance protein-like MFS transporter
LICVAAPWCTICISLLVCLLKSSTPKQPDYLTGALGSIGTAVYRSQVAHDIPAGIPANAAGDTLGGAVATASQLPSYLSTTLLGFAREAFTNGLHTVAGLSAAIVAVLAVFVIVLLRRVRPGGETSSAL